MRSEILFEEGRATHREEYKTIVLYYGGAGLENVRKTKEGIFFTTVTLRQFLPPGPQPLLPTTRSLKVGRYVRPSIAAKRERLALRTMDIPLTSEPFYAHILQTSLSQRDLILTFTSSHPNRKPSYQLAQHVRNAVRQEREATNNPEEG
ncbi:MAG: hypothetical protein Q9200_005975 [Gallowayella weberi]